jgi:hypothetical protein
MMTEYGQFDETVQPGGEQAVRAADLGDVPLGVGDVGTGWDASETEDAAAESYADTTGTDVIGTEAAVTGGDDDPVPDDEHGEIGGDPDDLLRSWAEERQAEPPKTDVGGGGGKKPPTNRGLGGNEAYDGRDGRGDDYDKPGADEPRDFVNRDGEVDPASPAAADSTLDKIGGADALPRPGESREDYVDRLIERFGEEAVAGAMNEDVPESKTGPFKEYNASEFPSSPTSGADESVVPDADGESLDDVAAQVDAALEKLFSGSDTDLPAPPRHPLEHPDPAPELPLAEPDQIPFEGVFRSSTGAGEYRAHTEMRGEEDDAMMHAVLDGVEVDPDFGEGTEAAYNDLVFDFTKRTFDSGADFAEIPLTDAALYNAAHSTLGEDNVDLVGGDGQSFATSEDPDHPKLVVDMNQPDIVRIFDGDGYGPTGGEGELNRDVYHGERFQELPSGTIEVWQIPRDTVDGPVWDTARLNSVSPNPEYTGAEGPHVAMVQEFGQRAYDGGSNRAQIRVDEPVMLEATATVFGRDNLLDEFGEPLDYDTAEQLVQAEMENPIVEARGIEVQVDFRDPDVAVRFDTSPTADE